MKSYYGLNKSFQKQLDIVLSWMCTIHRISTMYSLNGYLSCHNFSKSRQIKYDNFLLYARSVNKVSPNSVNFCFSTSFAPPSRWMCRGSHGHLGITNHVAQHIKTLRKHPNHVPHLRATFLSHAQSFSRFWWVLFLELFRTPYKGGCIRVHRVHLRISNHVPPSIKTLRDHTKSRPTS